MPSRVGLVTLALAMALERRISPRSRSLHGQRLVGLRSRRPCVQVKRLAMAEGLAMAMPKPLRNPCSGFDIPLL